MTMTRQFPFTALVGSDDLTLALLLTAISPSVGGVLVRGEKGTAKSTAVRALAELLPAEEFLSGCRFGCDPGAPDPVCPDDARHEATAELRPARLVELPVGATEDRVTGSLDLERALGHGEAAFSPGLLAEAHRGILYVDEVNLLHDHLVDLLLDAAAMGRCTVERDGVSVSHAARIVLVGTMNPEEGELRPQLLDRFGLTVEVLAPRDPRTRVEIVRRRLAFDADPSGFTDRWQETQRQLESRIAHARRRITDVTLPDRELRRIARVCAGFEVDGMRADIITARAAVAHAAWSGCDAVTRADVRAAARLALPHRRRRNPFDSPGLDEELLERLLDEPDDEPDPDSEPDPDQPGDDQQGDEPGPDTTPQDGPGPDPDGTRDPQTPPLDRAPDNDDDSEPIPPRQDPLQRHPEHADQNPTDPEEAQPGIAPTGVAGSGDPFQARTFQLRGVGRSAAGRRSRAITDRGRAVSSHRGVTGPVHLPATLRAAAPHQRTRHSGSGSANRVLIRHDDLRRAVTEGRESNLLLFCVDASGSMAARRRMEAVKTAVCSLLLDAYRRRDKVGLVSFRGSSAELLLPPTGSVEIASARLAELPHGGRTPLAEGLLRAAEVLRVEKVRDPRGRPLLVVVTDGRATAGTSALERSRRAADLVRERGISCLVVDCEAGRLRLGLARELGVRLDGDYVALEDLAAGNLLAAVEDHARSDDRGRHTGRAA